MQTRRMSNNEVEHYISIIRRDSESSEGTWSLATMNKFQAFFPNCSLVSSQFIVNEIVSQIKKTSNFQTRYKLAQLCSFINHMKLPFFINAMVPHITEIREMCEKFRSDHLGPATCSLLLSTFNEESLSLKSKSPPPTFSPFVRNLSVRSREGGIISRTPDH